MAKKATPKTSQQIAREAMAKAYDLLDDIATPIMRMEAALEMFRSDLHSLCAEVDKARDALEASSDK